jgi:hypothetical protein
MTVKLSIQAAEPVQHASWEKAVQLEWSDDAQGEDHLVLLTVMNGKDAWVSVVVRKADLKAAVEKL